MHDSAQYGVQAELPGLSKCHDPGSGPPLRTLGLPPLTLPLPNRFPKQPSPPGLCLFPSPVTYRQSSFSQFVEEAGPDQAATVVRLWEDPSLTHLILFGDSEGKHLAVLPIGPNTDYPNLERALRLNIEGLWARCWTYSLASLWAAWSQTLSDSSEVEAKVRLLEKGEEELRRRSAQLDAREAELEPRFQEVAAREAYIATSENALAEKAERLNEREAELDQKQAEILDLKARIDQREAELVRKEQTFFRNAGAASVPKAVPATGG